MPRKGAVPHEEILEAFFSTSDYFSSEGAVHPPAHPVWKAVASKLNDRLTPKYLWLMIRQDRNGFQEKIRTYFNLICEKEVSAKSSEPSTSPIYKSDISSTTDSEPQCVRPQKDFIVTISPEVWRELHPSERTWKSSDRPNGRAYLQFEKGWTSKIINLLWSQHQIPCPYTFKKLFMAKDSYSAGLFLKINAVCQECGSTAVGTMIEPPLEGESSVIIWRAVDTRGILHSKKRPIAGELRKQVGREVRYTAASTYRRTEAAKSMHFGGPEPPNLPTNNTIRKIKQEGISDEMQLPKEDDPISALIGMKYRHPYAGVIHEIGADKFMVSYHSPAQRRFYREFRKQNYSIISLDATGSLVQKIRRPGGRSGHIFLYEGVINTGNAQFPVFQLLSEKHDANSICYWLSEWERCGQLSPHQVVCDQSKALLSAVAKSFGKSASYKKYKETCFLALTENKYHLPPCFIRIDIAHFMSVANKWTLWKETSNKRIKDFYMRCLGLLVKCESLDQFEAVIFNIFCCALAETDGLILGSKEPTPSDSSRIKLLDWLETFHVDLEDTNLMKVICDPDGLMEDNEENINEECDKAGVTEAWICSLFQRATDAVEKAEGDRLSPYFSPPIGQKFRLIAHDFVVWSGVLVKLFKAPNITASSASVEGDFNDLKRRILQGDVGPLAAHKFVAKHITAIERAVLLASTTFAEKSLKRDEKSDAVELQYLENWKGQAVPPKKRRVPKYVVPCPEIKAMEEVEQLKIPPPSLQLIKNGNLTGFVKFKNITAEVKNTCSFDSVCQIISLIYSESDQFRSLMTGSENLTMKTCKSLALHGSTTETYILRCQALAFVLEEQRLQHLSGSNKKGSFVKYECYGNVGNLVRKLFQDMPSMTAAHSCFNTPCMKNMKMNIARYVTLDVNANLLLTRGLPCLELAIANWLQNSQKPCCEKQSLNCTTGPLIFVDIDFLGVQGVGSAHGVDEMYNGPCSIKDIPLYVKISGEKVVLRGAVAYQPGHYIGYARHLSGQWDAHDDMSSKVFTAVKEDFKILPHLLIYSKF